MKTMSSREARDRKKIIREGVDRFLDEVGLDVAPQNLKRIIHNVFVCFADEKSISISGIHNYLKELFDYHEFQVNAQDDSDSPILSEEALVRIITSAHTKDHRSKIWVALVAALLIVLVYVLWPVSEQKITVAQAEELKRLVADVAKVENITSASIWAKLKKSDEITQYGYQPSYKSFSENQYHVAKAHLENRVKDLNIASNAKPAYTFASSRLVVVDGDTFKADNKSYRLYGIDAFEMKQECTDSQGYDYRCGEKAKDELTYILSLHETLSCAQSAIDRYGRPVVDCEIGGKRLGDLLVGSGWALNYTKYSHDQFKEAEDTAKNRKAGAWKGCFQAPWDYRRNIPANRCYWG